MSGWSSGGKRRPERGSGSLGSRIHQGLVGARALIGTPYLADPSLRREYEDEVAPRTRVALGRILAEVFPGRRPQRGPFRVLDLGAGTGAAGVAVAEHFEGDLDLVAVDRVRLGGSSLTADVTDAGTLARLASAHGTFDLVVAAHVLNELAVGEPDARRIPHLATLTRRWCDLFLGDVGTLILLEPALRETSRALLGVRDQLLAAGLHVVAPCFFTGPCPALQRERDWCHDTAAAPNGRRVDFSYLVMRASGEAATDPTLFRIVSDPLPEKGRLKLYACGISGRHAVVRLDRHAAAANTDLDHLTRGEVATIARMTFAQDGLRVVKDTAVVRRVRNSPAAGDPV